MPEVRHGTLEWPNGSPNIYAIQAAAEEQAWASVADDEWVADVQLGTGRPQKGNESVAVWPFSYQVAKRSGGESIAARPR
ncbi:hypothetical protein [Mycobacterium dioxanotrophicus]|nr:hypothetical protein [Mycobacterium dioxanotrophicus]